MATNSSVVTESPGYDHVVAPIKSPSCQSDFDVRSCSLWQETHAAAEAKSGYIPMVSLVTSSMKYWGAWSPRICEKASA